MQQLKCHVCFTCFISVAWLTKEYNFGCVSFFVFCFYKGTLDIKIKKKKKVSKLLSNFE